MRKIDQHDSPVYWDPERLEFYWIEWFETGNNDIPKRHYINVAELFAKFRRAIKESNE